MVRNTVRHTVSRRELLRRAWALSVLGGATALAAACTQPPPSAPASKSSAPQAGAAAGKTAEPRKGGTLTWALWDKFDDFDTAGVTTAGVAEVLGNVVDTLIMADGNQALYPGLATSWKLEDGGKRFVFTLRDGVKFHDGTPFDSTAVKRTWERILDPATKATDVVAQFGPVDKIEAPDPKTVAVSFKEPYPTFLVHIWRAWWGILSPKYLDTLKPGDKTTAPVGTGPFKWGSRSADGVVTLDANPDYAWGPETLKNRNAPYVQSVKFRAVTEASTRLATLESGENLIIDEVSEPDYARLKGDSRFRFVETPRRSHTFGFFINVELPPTNDRAVREALNWSVDRASIANKLFFGVHKVAAGPLSEGVWGRLDELDQRFSYDPKKASQILEEAGWKAGTDGIREKGGQKLSLLLVTFRSPWTEMAEAMQAQVREAGIDLQVQKMERGPYLDLVRGYKHNLCASASTSLDPDGILRVVYHSSNRPRNNFSNLSDPALDALLDQGARQEMGTPERKKTYEDAQRRVMELLPFVGIMSQVRVQATSAKVNDFQMGPDGLSAAKLTSVWLDG